MPRSKMQSFLSSILLLVAMTLAANVAAQESNQTFTLYDPLGQQVGVYETQEAAEAAISSIPAPDPIIDGIFSYVNEIKSIEDIGDGLIKVNYWMGIFEPNDKDWSYPMGDSDFATEQEAIDEQLRVTHSNYPACPNPTAQLFGDWYMSGSDGTAGGQIEYRDYDMTYYQGMDCVQHSVVDQLSRERYFDCPPQEHFTYWTNAAGGCVNDRLVVSIVTQKAECSADPGTPTGLAGNPCDVKTGEKFETESDFDLGWMALTRYYHSGVATTSGGFGLGWSNSHQIHLAIGPSSLGLVEGSGYILPFEETNGEYRAASGSGERIIPSGDDWKLYRQDAVYTFGQDGHLVSRIGEDGNGLLYAYDEHGRLGTITSLQGRSVAFQYGDTSGDALITGVSSAGIQLAAYTYDEGRLKTVTYPDGGQRTYLYEDARFPRHLTGITAEDGQRFSTFAYDAKGRAVSSQHAGGADGITLSYSSAGTLVTDALGEQTTYAMTNAGGGTPKVSAVTNSAGTASYAYYDLATDFRRRLDTSTDRTGVITKHTYAEVTESGVAMNVHTVQEAFGLPEQRTTITRTAADSNRLLFVQSDRSLTDYTRNARLQPTSITTTDLDTDASRTTTIAYCEAADVSASGSTCPILGLVKSINGPRTDVSDLTQYAYYASDDAGCATPGTGTCTYRKGDLWKVTNALGQVTETLAYDAGGRALSVKDTNGVTTQYEYSPRGWLTAIKLRGTSGNSETDDRITTIAYWPTGLVKRVTQPDGAYTNYTYDAAHRLTDVADNAGNTIHYTLDKAGNRLKEDTKDASGTLKRTLSRVYDQLGQLETQADAAANPTDFAYDANGNPTSVTDALGRATQNAYDPLGRLKQTLQDTAGIKAKTILAYDAQDQLTQVTDPKGLDTTYTYNGLGDLTKLVSPDTGTTVYTYDSAGNRISQADARGKTATYTYDALNRLTGVQAGADPAVTYTYDSGTSGCPSGAAFPKGRLTRLTDASGSTQYCYNRFGDLAYKAQTTGTATLAVRYGHNARGQLTSITYPDGSVVAYTYGTLGRPTAVKVTPAGATQQTLLSGVTYAPFGPATGWTYGNGRTLARTLDLDGRPATVHDPDTGGLSVAFGYDEVGDLVELGLPGSTLPQAGLAYDALGRLTQFKDGPTGTPIDTYAYDAIGNRTGVTTSAGTTAYTYPATSHRLSKVGSVTRTYGGNGITGSIGGTAVNQFVYNDTGRMKAVKLGGTTVQSYHYNGKGERVDSYLGTDHTYTLYDEAGHWLGDYNSTGTPIQQALWLDDMPVGLLTGAAASLSYIEPDHLGSPRVVIDPVADTAIWKWDIKGEAFGATAPEEDPDGNGVAFTLDLRFPGQRYDRFTGLNYNYFRDYEPGTGRYIQSDPIGLSGGVSSYSYTGSAPISAKDIHGLAWESADGQVPGWIDRIIVGYTVHAMFSSYVESNGYGANDTYGGTFNNLRPDAYDRSKKRLWELKPLSNRDREDLYRGVALPQVRRYLGAANRTITNNPRTQQCTGWEAGASDSLFAEGQFLGSIQLGAGIARRVYNINLYHDTHPGDTGLVFYQADQAENPIGRSIEQMGRELSKGVWWLPPPVGIRQPQN